MIRKSLLKIKVLKRTKNRALKSTLLSILEIEDDIDRRPCLSKIGTIPFLNNLDIESDDDEEDLMGTPRKKELVKSGGSRKHAPSESNRY